MTCEVLTLPVFKPCGKAAVWNAPPYPCTKHAESLKNQTWPIPEQAQQVGLL